MHQTQISYVIFADSKTLITAGTDCTISLWAIVSTPDAIDLQPKACLFGHRASVNVLAVSRSFSGLLSASTDGQVLLWDLNRHELVRRLTEGAPVEVSHASRALLIRLKLTVKQCACINDVTGMIALCRGSEASLWTLNGDPILEQNVCVEGDNSITSCAFFEGSGSEHLERELLFVGHKKGVVNVSYHLTISLS